MKPETRCYVCGAAAEAVIITPKASIPVCSWCQAKVRR